MSKRQHRRHSIDHPAIVILRDGARVNCRIQNFSNGGLFLVTTDNIVLSMPSGAAVSIQIPKQHETAIIQTTTVHSSVGGLGVAFVKQEAKLIDYLQQLISTANTPRSNTGTIQGQSRMGRREIAIVNWIDVTTEQFLRSRYPEFIKSSYDKLFEAANNAGNNKTQTSLFDSYNTFKSHQERVNRIFLDEVKSSFRNFISGNHPQENPAYSQSEEPEMELVDQEDFEEWVAVVSLTRNLEFEAAAKLQQLNNSLSYLAKTNINNESNPVSPYSLLWSFKNSFTDLDISLEAKKLLFSSFRNNMLKDIGALYNKIGLYLDERGITKPAQEQATTKQEQHKPTPTRVSKQLTDNLSSLLHLVGNKGASKTTQLRPEEVASREIVVNSLAKISAAGRRPILQKIEEQLSGGMLDDYPGMVDSETRRTIEVSEQLLGSLQQDSFVNPEIQNLIDSLKIPFVREAISNPILLNDTNHPGHKLLDTIGRLGPYISTVDKDRHGKGFVYQTIEEISKLTELGAQLDINEVTNHLERIIEHQKNKLKTNLDFVAQSCEQDEKYQAAKKYVYKLLCTKLVNGTIPIVIEQLLYLGWVGLLTHTISTLGKNNKSSIRLVGVIDLLLDIFNAEQGMKPIAKTQRDYLLKVIKTGFAKYPLYADDAEKFLERLEAILESGGVEHSAIANKRVKMDRDHLKQLLDEQTRPQPEDIPSPTIEKSWLDLVEGIKLDDWIVEQRQLGRVRMLALAWKNADATRYVFVDGEGKKRLDTKQHQLAHMFKQQRCSLLEDGNVPIVERAVNRLLQNTFEQIKSENDTDDLTGLPRRRALQRKISELLDVTNDIGDHHIMLELDIDQFNTINDLCGHKGGDKLLQTFANIISSYLPENAIVARTGEDEFGILIKNCSLDEGYHIAETQRRALENLKYTWDGTTIPATASVGVVHIDIGTRSAAEVMNMALAARRMAVQEGGNCTKIYQPTDLDIEKQNRMTLSTPIIEDTLKNNRLSLFAQPITSVFLGESDEHHYEILLRINNDDGTWDGPDEFIQAAEKCNRMRSVDRWVISQIFAWLQNHHMEINNTSLSINLSAQTLDDESFFAFINDQLDSSPFPCDKITFEITETSLVKHIEKARALIEGIKQKGCKFSLDDFGTGYSSYSYLKDFPVDHVKIDGIFIKDILADSSSYAMVKSITEISHHMGKKVVAEYVENEAILVALRELEVDFAQGYYLGQPTPIKNLLRTAF